MPYSAIRRLLSATLVALLTAATAGLLSRPAHAAPIDDLPVLGDAASGVVSRQTEQRIGEDFMRQLRARAPLADDPLLTYYTEHLVFDLAEHSELQNRALDVVLINAPQINAFAAPGGVVGINLGNFSEAQSIHEFSSIIAHELAHLSQRHFARGVERSQQQGPLYLAGLLASAVLMATTGSDAGLAAMSSVQAAARDSQLRYSRGREREADRLGIDTLAEAGMNPHAMSAMFERMQRASRFSNRPPEFLLTHPVTESRIADARNQAAQFERRQYEDPLGYHLMRARVQMQLAENPSRAANEFRVRLEQGRVRFPAAARYGLTLALTALGRYEDAEQALAPLLAEAPERLAYILARSRIEMARGEAGQAITRLANALAINPDNLPLSMAYADALNEAERYAQAQKVLENMSELRPNDASIWYRLAETAGLAGDIVMVHRARAEYFQLNGRLQNALEHLRYALQLVEGNYQMTARLTQRMQDIRELRQRIASS